MSKTITIAIADDHDLIREGLKKILSKAIDIMVVAEAKDGKQLIELSKKIKVDVYIIDIAMPKLDGIETTRSLIKLDKQSKILAYSFMDNEYSMTDMLEAGALGYMVKNSDKSEIISAIRSVATGKPYFCEHTTPTMLELIKKSKFNPFTLKFDEPLFEEKERRVIDHLCEGKTSQEIGEKLFLSTRTIEGIRLGILKKMGVRNTAGLILYAVKTGLYRI